MQSAVNRTRTSILAVLGAVALSISISVPRSADAGPPVVRLSAAAFGRSGALRAHVAEPGEPVEVPLEWDGARPAGAWHRWIPVLGTVAPGVQARIPIGGMTLDAPSGPGVYELEVGVGEEAQRFEEPRLVVRVPAAQKRGDRLEGYRIGHYPDGSGRYAPPAGYMRVTPANQGLRLSDHFTVREFLTHDQGSVWPKFVVIDPLLLDKLELVLQELTAMGVPAERMIVMSGYRTPQYNRQGLGNGRAKLSRHQYGDAADVWVDNDGDGYMDDLNRDGRRDTGDARLMLKAMERVEARYPELVGGGGIYRDNGAHGPFLHIDVRGRHARW